MTKTVTIYGLYDPRDGALRYIGKATNPERRLREHLSVARRGSRTHTAKWLRRLMALGLKPEVRALELTTGTEWEARERFWIASFKECGARLTNALEGGEGGPTMKGRRFSDSHRKAISKALKGHEVSKRSREVARQMRLGKALKPRIPLDVEAIKTMYLEQGLTSYQIAEAFGVNPSTVQSRLKELGITRGRRDAQLQKRGYHLIPAAIADTAIQSVRGR